MKLNREISLGNVVSWALILIGAVAGYTRMQANVAIAQETAREAKAKVEASVIVNSKLTTDVEVIKVTVINIEKNLDEIKRDHYSKQAAQLAVSK